MQKLMLLFIVASVVWFINKNVNADIVKSISNTSYTTSKSKAYDSANEYECDGRQYCSQMTSCEEARFFLENCPNPKMDGNNDGVPCERQWCK